MKKTMRAIVLVRQGRRKHCRFVTCRCRAPAKSADLADHTVMAYSLFSAGDTM